MSFKEIYLHLYLLRTQLNYFLLGVLPFLILSWITGAGWVMWFALITVAISLLDLRSRYLDFVRIRRRINLENHMHYVNSMHFSPCRRNVTAAAYGDIGFIKRIYHEMGYRWYHMLPDQLHKRIFSWSYWQAALFRKN